MRNVCSRGVQVLIALVTGGVLLPNGIFAHSNGTDRPTIKAAHDEVEIRTVSSVSIEPGGAKMMLRIPESLKLEHEELHAELVKATKAGGRTGEAAKAVAKVLHEHFLKEEEFALPPIGLLAPLARGEVNAGMKSVVAMTDRLKAELPEMLEEHKAVVAALEKLSTEALAENKPEHTRFAEKLMLHAKTEEEVLYPAAILVGEYLKLKLGSNEK
jgi:hypothetical protein